MADAHPTVSLRAVDAKAVTRVLASVPICGALGDAVRTELVATFA